MIKWIFTTSVILLLTFTVLSLSGCIYSFNPGGESTISTIAVEPLANETTEYGLSDRLTEIIIDAFIADGNIKVVSSEGAETILIGSLKEYKRVVEQFDENDQVQQYKVMMTFEITLRNGKDQTDIWTETMRQEGLFDAASETEEDGQQRAGTRLVEAIIDKTTKSW